jgi:hydrogenase maturation protease
VQLGAAPGTVHVVRWSELPAPDGAVSAHGIGVREAVEVTRLIFPERAPRNALLVGIEGQQFDRLGEPMSPQVADAIPRAVAQVLALLADASS